MRMILSGIAAVATLLATPVAAWTPVSTTFALSGVVNTCPFTGTLVTDSGGSATITAADVSGTPPPCTVQFMGTPYAVTALSSTSVKISNVRIIWPTGECRGNLIGTWNNMTATISLSTTLPSVVGGPPCPVIGSISTTPLLFM